MDSKEQQKREIEEALKKIHPDSSLAEEMRKRYRELDKSDSE